MLTALVAVRPFFKRLRALMHPKGRASRAKISCKHGHISQYLMRAALHIQLPGRKITCDVRAHLIIASGESWNLLEKNVAEKVHITRILKFAKSCYLAATCSHLQPLAATCSHLQPIEQPLATICSQQPFAATVKRGIKIVLEVTKKRRFSAASRAPWKLLEKILQPLYANRYQILRYCTALSRPHTQTLAP